MVKVDTIKKKHQPARIHVVMAIAQRYIKSIKKKKSYPQLAGVISGISGCKPYILWNSVVKMGETTGVLSVFLRSMKMEQDIFTPLPIRVRV